MSMVVFTLRPFFTASGCGGPKDLIGAEGSVSSMGFPGSYSNKARCQWNIQVPDGKLVHLHFRNFSLEESDICMNDKVSLRDRLGSLGMGISNLSSSTYKSEFCMVETYLILPLSAFTPLSLTLYNNQPILFP
uniref:CUB domain-containing protein n=1 Tax=Sphaeramia orbicularis TaxID=375764 RepID=A0A672YVA8_9TELE